VIPLDEKDLTLLHLLEENCRTPVSDLAVMAELSEQDTKERIERLEAAASSAAMQRSSTGNGPGAMPSLR